MNTRQTRSVLAIVQADERLGCWLHALGCKHCHHQHPAHHMYSCGTSSSDSSACATL